MDRHRFYTYIVQYFSAILFLYRCNCKLLIEVIRNSVFKNDKFNIYQNVFLFVCLFVFDVQVPHLIHEIIKYIERKEVLMSIDNPKT